MNEFSIYGLLAVLATFYTFRMFGEITRKYNWNFWYQNIYLKSLHWRFLRWRKKFWMAVTLGVVRCEKCGSRKYLNVHHITYTHLWHEPLSDLQIICHDCHRRGSGRI